MATNSSSSDPRVGNYKSYQTIYNVTLISLTYSACTQNGGSAYASLSLIDPDGNEISLASLSSISTEDGCTCYSNECFSMETSKLPDFPRMERYSKKWRFYIFFSAIKQYRCNLLTTSFGQV